jgi:hypothetical protein
MTDTHYPAAIDPERVGTYPALAGAGGGYVWDEVLEYRVWCHPADGGDDYFHAFATYSEALAFSRQTNGAEVPLALIRQDEHINEPQPGIFVHIKTARVTEWPVEFLNRPFYAGYRSSFVPCRPPKLSAISSQLSRQSSRSLSRVGLSRTNRPDSGLAVVARCTCGEENCAHFYTASPPSGARARSRECGAGGGAEARDLPFGTCMVQGLRASW